MNFWKIFFASFAAIIVATIVSTFLLISMGVASLATFGLSEMHNTKNSVLCIDFAEDIIDSPQHSAVSSVDIMNMNYSQPLTLRQVLTAIESAATDPNIKGICIRPDGLGSVSMANLEEIRAAILKFKQSSKFVVAYADGYTQSSYYLASAADEVFLQPEGSLDWRGMALSTMFYKGLLDKFDIDVEIFRPTVCRYKSAVEPFFLTKMSDANRKQLEVLANSVWNTVCEDVAASRELKKEDVMRYAADLSISLSEDALRYGFVDRLIYEDELYNLFDSFGVERDSRGHSNDISLGEYVTANSFAATTVTVNDNIALEFVDKPLMAVIYAEGDIVDGDDYIDGNIFGTSLAREIRQARLDERTKAVVVRVNSPGGSALASDVVWREMVLLQQTKPVVISMGGTAASGGYYISAPADLIVANRTTITGSIGVFGMMMNCGDALKKHLGVTMDSAATSPNALAPGMFNGCSEAQRAAIMKGVDRVYESFTSKVAEGRNLTIEQVYNIAEGRVWSGSDAVTIGLADMNGGFTEAISAAANLADLGTDFHIYEFVSPTTPFESWINSMGMVMAREFGLDYTLAGEQLNEFVESTHQLIEMQGIQTLCPGELKIEL